MKHIILTAQVGSKAYGLDTKDSDSDSATVSVFPLREFLDFRGHGKDSVQRKDILG